MLVRFAGTRLAGDRRRSDADRAAPWRAHAGRRAVLGDAQAPRAVRSRQSVLRPRRARRSDHDCARCSPSPSRASPPRPGRGSRTARRCVTADRRGKGLIVLFHVTADTTWSNLPLSGLFVDMLRKIVALAGAPRRTRTPRHRAPRRASQTLPPSRTLDGFGVLGAPPVTAKPIPADFAGTADAAHPPGFYGSADALIAVNALAPTQELSAADYGALARCRRGAPRMSPRRSIFANLSARAPLSSAFWSTLWRASGSAAPSVFDAASRSRRRSPSWRCAPFRWRAAFSAGVRRRTGADLGSRQRRGSVDPSRLCRHRRRRRRRDIAARRSPLCRGCSRSARPLSPGEPFGARSGARRTQLSIR